MTNKPRIKRALCRAYGGYMWWCVGDGVSGKHHTPKNAYIEWKTSMFCKLAEQHKTWPMRKPAKRT